MSDQVQRNYIIDDLMMLQRAQVFHDAFVIDQPLFEADLGMFAAPFAADFQASIDASDAIAPASVVDGEIVYVTNLLNAQLPLGRKALQKLYNYVDIVFNNKAKDREFEMKKINITNEL
jgi:hypothetical protein